MQVALFVLFAWAYPRLRAGLRATLAIFVGIFMATMSIEAINYLRESSISGDDYTGLLTIPAGRSSSVSGSSRFGGRGRTARPIRRYVRRALLAFGLVLGAVFVILPGVPVLRHHPHGPGLRSAGDLGAAYETSPSRPATV